MNWEDYKELSKKTMSTEFHVGAQVENLLHGVIGILTELEELLSWEDEVNKKEEVADIFWYIALLDRELSLNLKIPNLDDNNFFQLKNEPLIIQNVKLACKALDQLKKKIYYNKPFEMDKFKILIESIFETTCIICNLNRIEISKILESNIQKLKSRFGDKFSSEKAIKRDLKQERTILEK
jgi:hypothetical protein